MQNYEECEVKLKPDKFGRTFRHTKEKNAEISSKSEEIRFCSLNEVQVVVGSNPTVLTQKPQN